MEEVVYFVGVLLVVLLISIIRTEVEMGEYDKRN